MTCSNDFIVVVIFFKEPLVFLSDIFKEMLTIGGTCVSIKAAIAEDAYPLNAYTL